MPPLDDDAVRAQGYQPGPRGWEPLEPEDRNPVGPEVTPARRVAWTAEELLAAEFPEPAFAVPGLVPEGLTFFAGSPKLGKSWLALGLSIAVAAGGRALGSIPVESGEVLYLSLEDSPRRLRERLSILLDGEDCPRGLQFYTEWPRLGEGGAERIGEWITEHPATRMVVVDVFTRMRPAEVRRSDLYRADYDAAAELQAVAIRAGVAITCIYHTRKAESSDFVETVQGTFGLAGGADTILVARRGRGEADATLHVTGRDIEERELALRFSPEARTWTLLGDADLYNLGETRREIIEALSTHGTLSPKQLAEVSDVPYERGKKTMQRMAGDGQIVGKNGRYTLPPQSAVPGVPLSPEEVGARDRGTPGTPTLGEPQP